MGKQLRISKVSPEYDFDLAVNQGAYGYWSGTFSDKYSFKSIAFYDLKSVLHMISGIPYLNLSLDERIAMEKLEEEDFIESLRESCKRVNANFWFNRDPDDPPKFIDSGKICNLCRHFSLLGGFCTITKQQKKAKDTCSDWKEV